MPILSPEPALFPEGLFEDLERLELGDRRWWVLHTRSRQEKCLARSLYQAKIGYYLPLIAQRCRIRGRVLTSHVPLFTGYVFLLADPDERLRALATCRAVRSLETKDQQGLWHDLGQIHRLIATGAPITPEQRLTPGMQVRIRSGPLAGLEGKITRTASGRRFVVQVNFIQQGASVLMEDFNLVQIEEAAWLSQQEVRGKTGQRRRPGLKGRS